MVSAVSTITLVVGLPFIREANHVRIWDEVHDTYGESEAGRVPQPA
ncbi:MAG: hypothetical protein IT306_22560 [Chloroflexi bacterium]|nr:hypothetical protein [Chloroflexota bacterium]